MESKLNKLKTFLEFYVKLPIPLTFSRLFISGLILSCSLFITPSKSIAQTIERDVDIQQKIKISSPSPSLTTLVFSYCQELASWNNNPPSGKTRSLGITIVTNNRNGLGRLYTGEVPNKISKFLGRATQVLISSSGEITTKKTSNLILPKPPSPYKSSFGWICGAYPEVANIVINYPESTFLGQKISASSETFKVKNIRLVANFLYGQVEESDGTLSEAIITYQKYESTIVK